MAVAVASVGMIRGPHSASPDRARAAPCSLLRAFSRTLPGNGESTFEVPSARVALDKLATLIWINAQASFVVDLAAESYKIHDEIRKEMEIS
jgi:hypothetical protein